MRQTNLICLFVIFGYVATAQFTILPQAGFENSRTSIELNELSCFSPLGAKLSPQAGVRLDYKLKKLHGPFLGVTTSRSVVKYDFSDQPSGMMNAYTASRGNTQLRLEGGYQVSTKPLYFKKSGSSSNKSSKAHCQKNTERKSCSYTMVKSSCGSRINKINPPKTIDKGSWVRIQPSVGIAYIPSTPSSEIYTKSQGSQNTYEYNAGNWKTAMIGGMGFEFGNNEVSKFIVSINYLKGMGNLDAKSITSVSGGKPAITTLRSNASSWNLRMGIPISFNKKKPVEKKQPVVEKTYKEYKEAKKCGQYKTYYKPRCSRG